MFIYVHVHECIRVCMCLCIPSSSHSEGLSGSSDTPPAMSTQSALNLASKYHSTTRIQTEGYELDSYAVKDVIWTNEELEQDLRIGR